MTWVGLNDDATDEEEVFDGSKKNAIWVSARDRGYLLFLGEYEKKLSSVLKTSEFS